MQGPQPAAPQGKPCGAKGCLRNTKEDKPFCPDHVELHPYVADLLERLGQRVKDDLAASGPGGHQRVRLASITAVEIVRYVSASGTRTFRRLCRDLALEQGMAMHYVTALQRNHLVSRSHHGKDHWQVHRPGESPQEKVADAFPEPRPAVRSHQP